MILDTCCLTFLIYFIYCCPNEFQTHHVTTHLEGPDSVFFPILRNVRTDSLNKEITTILFNQPFVSMGFWKEYFEPILIWPATTLLARASAITSDHLMRITQEPIVISYYALLLLPAQSYTGPQHWTKNEKDSATVLLTWVYTTYF